MGCQKELLGGKSQNTSQEETDAHQREVKTLKFMVRNELKLRILKMCKSPERECLKVIHPGVT